MSPYFVKTAKSEASLFIKTVRRPNCQVRDCVTRAVSFAKNVRMTMTFERLSLSTNPGKDAGRAIALIGPFAERSMHTVGDGRCLRYARRVGTHHGVAGDGGASLAACAALARCGGEGLLVDCHRK